MTITTATITLIFDDETDSVEFKIDGDNDEALEFAEELVVLGMEAMSIDEDPMSLN
jgi:hypothetical protein